MRIWSITIGPGNRARTAFFGHGTKALFGGLSAEVYIGSDYGNLAKVTFPGPATKGCGLSREPILKQAVPTVCAWGEAEEIQGSTPKPCCDLFSLSFTLP